MAKAKRFKGETIMIANEAANKAFNNVGMCDPRVEIPEIPGFHHADTFGDTREARKGRVLSIFMITRMSDGKLFATDYYEAANDNEYVESPFFPQTKGEREFREIHQKERIVTETYYEYF